MSDVPAEQDGKTPESGLSMDDEIVAAIRRIMRAVDLHSHHLIEQCGLTLPQLATLRAVERMGSGSMGALARQLHLSSPTVTGILDRLEKRGLVSRTRSGDDRRNIMVTMSPAGAEVLSRAPSPLQDRFRHALGGLHEWERHMILSVLQRITQMMAAETLDASPVLMTGPVDSEPNPTPP